MPDGRRDADLDPLSYGSSIVPT